MDVHSLILILYNFFFKWKQFVSDFTEYNSSSFFYVAEAELSLKISYRTLLVTPMRITYKVLSCLIRLFHKNFSSVAPHKPYKTKNDFILIFYRLKLIPQLKFFVLYFMDVISNS